MRENTTPETTPVLAIVSLCAPPCRLLTDSSQSSPFDHNRSRALQCLRSHCDVLLEHSDRPVCVEESRRQIKLSFSFSSSPASSWTLAVASLYVWRAHSALGFEQPHRQDTFPLRRIGGLSHRFSDKGAHSEPLSTVHQATDPCSLRKCLLSVASHVRHNAHRPLLTAS